MRVLERILRGAFAVALLAMLSGCATSALWNEGAASFHEPFPPSRLALFDVPEKGDVLAQYDELAPGRDTPRRRACFLLENDSRIKAVKKPRFVSLSATNGLAPIPLFAQSAVVPSETAVYARTNTTGNGVTIFRNDQRWHEAFALPTYRCWITGAKRATLTPLTVVLDVTVVGGYLYALAFCQSGSHISFSL